MKTYFVLMFLSTLAISSDKSPDTSDNICAQLSSVTGDRSKVVITSKGKNITPIFLQDLYCGDKITVTQNETKATISFFDQTLETISAENSTYYIEARGKQVTARSKLWDFFGAWFTNRNTYQPLDFVSRGEVKSKLSLQMARMQSVKQTVLSGVRSFSIIWTGGDNSARAFITPLHGKNNKIIAAKVRTIADGEYEAYWESLNLSEGKHEIRIENGKGVQLSTINAVKQSPVACIETSQPLNAFLEFIFIASIENGKFALDAYHHAIRLPVDERLKNILAKDIIHGLPIPQMRGIKAQFDDCM